MSIELVWGSGEGTTELSAFDAALADAGIHNYNLIRLSSVIPKGESVESVGSHRGRWDVGNMVGAVLAERASTSVDETVAAGLGWARSEEGGVFFEASGESAADVETRLRRGIRDAKSTRDAWRWEPDVETRVVEHTVEHANAGAAVVAAVYEPLTTASR